jgi:DNA-binding MarR family transcriptional regulator
MTDATRRRDADAVPPTGRIDMSGLDDTLGFLLKRAQIAVSSQIHGTFAEFDITAVQFSVLTVVANNPGITQGDIAAALQVERPRMVPVLDALARRGLAERRHDSRDGRSRRIHLTDTGVAMLGLLQRRFAVLEKRLTSALGRDSRERLLTALRILAEPPY